MDNSDKAWELVERILNDKKRVLSESYRTPDKWGYGFNCDNADKLAIALSKEMEFNSDLLLSFEERKPTITYRLTALNAIRNCVNDYSIKKEPIYQFVFRTYCDAESNVVKSYGEGEIMLDIQTSSGEDLEELTITRYYVDKEFVGSLLLELFNHGVTIYDSVMIPARF